MAVLRSASSFSNRSFSRSNEGGSLGSASTEVTHSRRRFVTSSSTGRVANWRNPFIRLSRNASFDMLWRATPTTQNGFGNNSPTARLYKEGMTQPVRQVTRDTEDDKGARLRSLGGLEISHEQSPSVS
jgi:hypothetical protein